jgi:hypothetical protein
VNWYAKSDVVQEPLTNNPSSGAGAGSLSAAKKLPATPTIESAGTASRSRATVFVDRRRVRGAHIHLLCAEGCLQPKYTCSRRT